jgi:hypothetical protein
VSRPRKYHKHPRLPGHDCTHGSYFIASCTDPLSLTFNVKFGTMAKDLWIRTAWLILWCAPLFLLHFSAPLCAQFVIATPSPGCLLPRGTMLTEVMDGTGPSIGVVYHPPVGSVVNAYLGPDTKQWIHMAFAGGCPVVHGADSIAIYLDRVTLTEAGSNERVRSGVFVEMKVLQWANDHWRIRYTMDGSSILIEDPHDSARHARHLMEVLRNGMTQFANARENGQLTDAPFAFPMSSHHIAFPIERKHRLPMGVFWTAEDFRQGRVTPVADSLLYIDRIGQLRLAGALRRAQDRIFALSDGTHYHVQWEGKFRELVWNGRGFVTTVSRMEVSSGMAITFGLMGAVLSARRVNIAMDLDLASGELRIADPYGPNGIEMHIIHFAEHGNGEQRLSLRVWDSEYVLDPGSYCEIAFPANIGPELVTITTPGGTLDLLVNLNGRGEGLHVIELDAGSKPKPKELTTEESMSLRAALEPGMRRQAVER